MQMTDTPHAVRIDTHRITLMDQSNNIEVWNSNHVERVSAPRVTLMELEADQCCAVEGGGCDAWYCNQGRGCPERTLVFRDKELELGGDDLFAIGMHLFLWALGVVLLGLVVGFAGWQWAHPTPARIPASVITQAAEALA